MSSALNIEKQTEGQVASDPVSRVEAPYPNPLSSPVKERGFNICINIATDPKKLHKFFTENFDTQEIFDILLFAIRNRSQQQCLNILEYIHRNKINFAEPGDQHAALIPTAIKHGFKALTLDLIRLFPNITEIKDINGNCPIHHAVALQDPDLIVSLVSKEVNLNTPNAAGLTPLCIAIETGNFKFFKDLISCGANINNPHERSPLFVACTFKDREKFVESLLCCGAILDTKNQSGKDLHTVALENGNFKSAQIIAVINNFTGDVLRAKSYEEIASSFNRVTESYAIDSNVLKYKFLLDNEITSPLELLQHFNSKKQNGHTLVHHTITHGHNGLFEFMMSEGFEVGAPDSSGLSPVMLAAICNQPRMYQQLFAEKGLPRYLPSGQSFANFIFSNLSAEQINSTIAIIAGKSLSESDNFVDIEQETTYLNTNAIGSIFDSQSDLKNALTSYPHQSFSRDISPKLEAIVVDKGDIMTKAIRMLDIDIAEIAGFDNLFHHEILEQKGNEEHRRAIQEDFLSETIFSRGDPRILRIALYMGIDFTEQVYTRGSSGVMEYQNPEDKVLEQENLPMINEIFSFFATCGSENNRVFKRCLEFYKDHGYEPPQTITLAHLYKSLDKENEPAPKRRRPLRSVSDTELPQRLNHSLYTRSLR